MKSKKFKYRSYQREDNIQIVIEPEYVLLSRTYGDSGSIICAIYDKPEKPNSIRIMRKTDEWDYADNVSEVGFDTTLMGETSYDSAINSILQYFDNNLGAIYPKTVVVKEEGAKPVEMIYLERRIKRYRIDIAIASSVKNISTLEAGKAVFQALDKLSNIKVVAVDTRDYNTRHKRGMDFKRVRETVEMIENSGFKAIKSLDDVPMYHIF